MATLYVYVGCSASGKTTLAYKRANENNDYVTDSDEVRQWLFGDATYQGDNEKVFRTMYQATIDILNKNYNVHYVATNLSSRRRITLIKDIKKKFPDTIFKCVVVIAPVQELYERNAARERHVPDYVIKKQLCAFQVPYMGEGWNSIEVVDNGENMEWVDEMWEDVKKFGDQCNPHHTLTLYTHLLECVNKVELWPMTRCEFKDPKTLRNSRLMAAAGLHDIGKAYTQSFDEEGIAHYYGHENYSAYLSLCLNNGLYITQLVNYHMIPYMDAAAQKTWRARLGDYMWDDLMRLHAADEAAH